MTDSTSVKVYTEEEMAQHIKDALDTAIHARLETDIKEIKEELVKLNNKIVPKLIRLETTVYYIFPILLTVLGLAIHFTL